MSDGISDSRVRQVVDQIEKEHGPALKDYAERCLIEGDYQFQPLVEKIMEEHKDLLDDLSINDHSGGLKFDNNKSRVDLVPFELIEEVGKVLAFGAKKYSEGNWSKGIDQKRLVAAAIRHTYQYSNGEDNDPESGLCHLAHAACNLAFALWMRKHRPELDTRWSKENK